jgi:Zn finger protein HypA/HybF involved in hydrogenase expression
MGNNMIIENQAVEVEGADAICAHKIEIYCPNCSRDVDEAELSNKVCNDCGADLSQPEQHVAVAVTSVPVVGITW